MSFTKFFFAKIPYEANFTEILEIVCQMMNSKDKVNEYCVFMTKSGLTSFPVRSQFAGYPATTLPKYEQKISIQSSTDSSIDSLVSHCNEAFIRSNTQKFYDGNLGIEYNIWFYNEE